MRRVIFSFLYFVVRVAMGLWHPLFTVEGRENIPDGPCVICSNHIGMADPIWTLFTLPEPWRLRIMAKESLIHLPLLGPLLRWVGLIGVKRGEGDIGAVKEALKSLKSGWKLLIYPEGTRAKKGPLEGKTGAVMLAQRANCPVLPVYIQRRRAPFSSLHLVIGKPYLIETAGPKATAEELRQQTDLLMGKIYEMGANVG